jgi:hypothetical protein
LINKHFELQILKGFNMSVSASIDIILSEKKTAVEIINRLMNFGWTLATKDGYIGYLPLGDKDDFHWQAEKISFEALTKILHEKERANEIVGVTMTWKDTEIGGSFLFWRNDSLETFSMCTDGNRQRTILDGNYEITDFQWYLAKLLPPLDVEYFSFYQI